MLSGLLCAGLGHRAGAWFWNKRDNRRARGNASTHKNERDNQWRNCLHKTQCTALVRPVRARGNRRADPRQDRRLINRTVLGGEVEVRSRQPQDNVMTPRGRCEGAPARVSTERIKHKSAADGRISASPVPTGRRKCASMGTL